MENGTRGNNCGESGPTDGDESAVSATECATPRSCLEVGLSPAAGKGGDAMGLPPSRVSLGSCNGVATVARGHGGASASKQAWLVSAMCGAGDSAGPRGDAIAAAATVEDKTSAFPQLSCGRPVLSSLAAQPAPAWLIPATCPRVAGFISTFSQAWPVLAGDCIDTKGAALALNLNCFSPEGAAEVA